MAEIPEGPPPPIRPEAMPLLNPREELLTDMLFGIPEVLDSATATDVHRMLEPVGKLSFDRGLSTPRTFKEGDHEFQAPGTDMLRRSAFIHLVNKWSQRHDTPITSVYMGDIAGLRNADLMRDPDGNSAADVLLNGAAAAIQKPLDAAGLTDDKMAYTCRYGGDEFAVAIMGNWTVEQRAELNRGIPAAIAGIEELPDQLKPVKLKGDQLQRIDRPVEDQLNRDIFDWFMKRGLILDTESIQRIHAQWGEGTDHRRAFERYRLENEKNIYGNTPDGKDISTTDFASKATYLSSKHAEFADAFKAATRLDERFNAGTQYRQGVVEFIENVVYDQLLGENFYTFDDFQEHITMGNMESVHVYDMKFIKEVNDNLGLVRGDEIIQAFWERTIKPKVDPQDLDKIIFGRRGGTLFLGLRSGMGGYPALKDSTREMLTGGVDEAQIDGARVPVGFSSGSVEQTNEGNIRLRLGDLFANSDRQWYTRIGTELAATAGSENSLLSKINAGDASILESLPVSDDQGNLIRENMILHYFLSPKRTQERREHLAEIMPQVIDVRDKGDEEGGTGVPSKV